MVLLVGPWVGYNMSRFRDPVYISSGFGVTLASANCPPLYRGPYEGYWSLECAVLAKDTFTPGADESVQASEAQAYAVRIIRHVGNYGEVYERNVGAGSKLGIPRGMNQLWSAGGIQYAPPIR